MYENYYGFREKPFNLTPDPSFLYLSEKHKEAFAHLLYGIRNRSGFIMVTGEIGTGKTTICRSLLSKLDPETEIAFIFNPILSAEELLRTINQDFGIDSKGATVKDLIDELNAYLLQRASEGKNCVLVIDEAQNLDPKVLEQVRLLSNLETETQKLLQIVLIGQPELAQMLATKELRQLNQRITARYHLKELDAGETLHYIAFRLRVAGGRRKVRFNRASVMKVYKFSKGTPRVVNAVCDRALLIGYTKETREITAPMVAQAIKEIRGEKVKLHKKKKEGRPFVQPAWVSTAALLMMGAFLYFVASNVNVSSPRQAAAPVVQPAAVVMPMPEPRVVEAAPVSLPEPELEAVIEVVEPALPDVIATADAAVAALSSVDAATSQRAALTKLLTLWKKDMPEEVPAIADAGALMRLAQNSGLRLWLRPATLDQIYAINMPVYAVVGRSDMKRPVAIVSRTDDHVELAYQSGDTLRVAPSVLAELYGGEAGFFWADPEPGARNAVPWQSGAHVKLVQEQLNRIGLTARTANGQFDEDTIDLIQKLQEAAGLDVDGVVGAQTRMVLASWDAMTESPLLSEPALPEIAVARLFGLLLDSANSVATPASNEKNVREARSEPMPQPEVAPVTKRPETREELDAAVAGHARTAMPPEVAAGQPPAEVQAVELLAPGQSILEQDTAASMKLVTPPAAGHVPLMPRNSGGELQAP